MTWGLSFYAEDLPGRTLAGLFADHGFHKECAEFKAEYEAQLARFMQLQPNFGAQFSVAGPVWVAGESARAPMECLRLPAGSAARCVNDEELLQRRFDLAADPHYWRESGIASGFDRIPQHGYLHLFHLDWHRPVWVHAQHVVPYTYRSDLRDRLGVPIPSVRIRLRDNDVKLLRDQVATQKAAMQAAGLATDFLISPLGIGSDGPFMPNAKWYERLMFRLAYKRSVAVGGAIHECGGARMGSDPKTSVLNPMNAVWDAPNVFVTDSSCFVTNGTCGPTLTTMALTVRACEHIASEYGHSPELRP